MKTPTISIIIPCYNQAEYIRACFDSILNQTFSDYEVIVVNDGSTDNSADIIREYCVGRDNWRMINQINSGVVAARNNAAAHARGTYLYPLDADDIILPRCLEILHRTITTTNNRVVACNVWTFGEINGFFIQPRFNKWEMYGRHECCVISALIYRSDFVAFGGYKNDFNGYGGDDMDYWLNYVDRDMPMTRVADVLFLYRTKAECKSVWRNYDRRVFRARTRHKNARLAAHHPRMRIYAAAYGLLHCRLARFIFRVTACDDKIQYRICKIPIFRRRAPRPEINAHTGPIAVSE